ncbi:hypothetical protein NPIL_430821 [Nephila pilipes]|uniref:Uncharacterized protein n=1 Tax=Nephila pilipes TaxID=299642 RepID=A0A8X6USP9_NEPPI|nr:hypothetical protein NPIL_430821 [Nephila pilipes]
MVCVLIICLVSAKECLTEVCKTCQIDIDKYFVLMGIFMLSSCNLIYYRTVSAMLSNTRNFPSQVISNSGDGYLEMIQL